MRNIEVKTGYGGWIPAEEFGQDLSIDRVLQFSDDISLNVVNMGNSSQHLQVARSVLSDLTCDLNLWPQLSPATGERCKLTDDLTPHITRQQYESVVKLFSQTASLLIEQRRYSEEAVSYLQCRLETQSKVLFTLLTHRDAIENRKLAKAS